METTQSKQLAQLGELKANSTTLITLLIASSTNSGSS